MPSSMCYYTMTCSSNSTSTTSDSIFNIGKIVGIVIGSLVGLALLICVVVVIYRVCCKRKSRVQAWTYPYPGSQSYGQPMPMYPYPHYVQGPIQQPQPPKIIEGPPPAYEEINTVEDSTPKV